MPEAQKQQSEVARLLTQITEEYEAGVRGLTGFAYGTSRHEFITRKMENMARIHTELYSLVGDAATAMIARRLDQIEVQDE